MYKIYVLSSKNSQLPYEIDGINNDKSKEINWRFIGEVDDYNIARQMIECNDCNIMIYGNLYNLTENPRGNNQEYDFCKIECASFVHYYDIFNNTNTFKRRIFNMILNEHKVARIVVKEEVLKMIEDFRNGNPILKDCDWEKDGKNYTFKNEFFNKTGRELTEKVIKHTIISEIRFNNFIDVIYPQWCETKDDCIEAIKKGHLYWVFHLENIETYDCHANDINIGDLYVKLEPISGEFYIVKSLHTPDVLDCDGKFTERDMEFVQIYDEFINGKIK